MPLYVLMKPSIYNKVQIQLVCQLLFVIGLYKMMQLSFGELGTVSPLME